MRLDQQATVAPIMTLLCREKVGMRLGRINNLTAAPHIHTLFGRSQSAIRTFTYFSSIYRIKYFHPKIGDRLTFPGHQSSTSGLMAAPTWTRSDTLSFPSFVSIFPLASCLNVRPNGSGLVAVRLSKLLTSSQQSKWIIMHGSLCARITHAKCTATWMRAKTTALSQWRATTAR